MSGGSFDYAYAKLDELERWPKQLDEMAGLCRSWAVSDRAGEKWSGNNDEHSCMIMVPTTLEDRASILVRAMLLERAAKKLQAAIEEVKSLAGIMHDVEWVASGDYGVDSLMGPLKDE